MIDVGGGGVYLIMNLTVEPHPDHPQCILVIGNKMRLNPDPMRFPIFAKVAIICANALPYSSSQFNLFIVLEQILL